MSDVIGLPTLGVDIASTGLVAIGVRGTSSLSSTILTFFSVVSLTNVGSSMTSSSLALSTLSFFDVFGGRSSFGVPWRRFKTAKTVSRNRVRFTLGLSFESSASTCLKIKIV